MLDSAREGQFTRFGMLEFSLPQPVISGQGQLMMTPGQTIAATVTLLAASNLFMTFAWYGHLKHLQASPWYVAAFVSWGIAFFEYLLQVPANRIGFAGGMSLAQLKILQEVITLAVFVPFAMLYMGETLKWNYLWAALCMVGAVYFIFRG
jgi:uncharacterized protein (DUF486 family)